MSPRYVDDEHREMVEAADALAAIAGRWAYRTCEVCERAGRRGVIVSPALHAWAHAKGVICATADST